MTRLVLVAIGVAVAVAVAWVRQPAGVGPAQGAQGQTPATFDSSNDEVAYGPSSLNQLVNGSDAIITGRVLSIAAARWNSDTGNEWQLSAQVVSAAPQGTAAPMQYRDATISVSSAVKSSPAVPVSTGAKVTVRLFGSGDDTGAQVDSPVPLSDNALDGPFTENSDVLVFLRAFDFPMQTGTQRVVTLTAHYEANFELIGDLAQSIDKERSSPTTALLSAVAREMKRGRLELSPAQAAATYRNPLAPTPGLGLYGALAVDPAKEALPPDAIEARAAITDAYDNYAASLSGLVASSLPPTVGPDLSDVTPAPRPQISAQTTAVYFQTPDHALVEYKVTTPQQGEVFRYGSADRVDGAWQVSQTAVCADLASVGGSCR